MTRKFTRDGENGSVGNQGNVLWDLFKVELEIPIVGSPERVFKALTRDIAAWWGEPYLHGEATNIILEPVVGGRLYEVWGKDMGSLWATVTRILPPRELRLVGAIGLPEPSHAVTTFLLEPKGEITVVLFTHEAFGNIGHDIRGNYVTGWKDLLENRLTSFVERGTHSGIM